MNESLEELNIINTETFQQNTEKVDINTLNKGFDLFQNKRYDEALYIFDELISKIEIKEIETPEIKETLANAHFFKGLALFKLEKYEEALTTVDELISKIETKEIETPDIENILASAKSSKRLILFNKGLFLFESGKFEKALTIFNEVISKEVEAPGIEGILANAHLFKGLALFKLEKYCEALKVFDELISKIETKEIEIPDIKNILANAWTTKGSIYYKFDMLTAARECFKKVLEIDQKNTLACNNLGIVLAAEGKLNSSKNIFEKTIKNNSDYSLGHANLAELFLNSGSVDRAFREIKMALNIERGNKNPDTHSAYIYCLDGQIEIETQIKAKKKKYSKAIESFEKAISFDVENPKYLLWCVYAKYIWHKFETSEIKYTKGSNPSKENISSKTEDICSCELFNSIIADLDKVLNFCKLPVIKGDKLSEKIKQSQWFVLFSIISVVILLYSLITSQMTLSSLSWDFFERIIVESGKVMRLIFNRLVIILVLLLILLFIYYLLPLLHSNLKRCNINHVLRLLILINTQRNKFDDYNEIKAYTLYLQGYFYYKLQDYSIAKEKLQDCIKLKPSKRIYRAAKDLLKIIWEAQKPPFWAYWFNSPIKKKKRMVFGFLIILYILLILFVHVENTESITWTDSKSRILLPAQINIYPYIISYPSNNTSHNSTVIQTISTNSQRNNNSASLNILVPTKMDIYPKIPVDNAFDLIFLLTLIFILISPSIRIVETLKLTLNRDVGGQTIGLETQIEAPPIYNFELSPSNIQDIINNMKG